MGNQPAPVHRIIQNWSISFQDDCPKTIYIQRSCPPTVQVAPGGAADVPYVMIVLDDTEARALFASDASVKALLDSVIAAYGEVSVSLLLIGFDRHLVAQDRRDHTHAVRTGMPPPLCPAAAAAAAVLYNPGVSALSDI